MRKTALAAAGLVATAALAACGPAASTSSHPPSGQDQSQVQAIVRCYRAHGDPGFPDPVYDPSDGNWHFAISPGTAPQATQQACRSLFPQVTASPPVPQAQFAALARFADCVRHHGVPGWPDPDPQGQFPLPPPLLTKSPAQEHAFGACRGYIPSGGVNVVAAPAS